MFKLIVAVSTCLVRTLATFETPASFPIVGDWADAINEKGLVRIPLQNPQGHSWFLDLTMGSPHQTKMKCVVDNNHALNLVFAKGCKTCPNGHLGYNSEKSKTYMSKAQNETVVTDDGFVVEGVMALDDTCYGMYGTVKQRANPETTVCISNQVFFHVSAQDDWDWGARATNKQHIDGVCGLGKEKASSNSQGMIARSVQAGDLKSNAYSIRLVPQTLALPIARDTNIPANRTPE